MDSNVRQLLEEEQRVNRMVKAERDTADALLKTVRKEVEIAIRSYKSELEAKFTERVAKVIHCPFLLENICQV